MVALAVRSPPSNSASSPNCARPRRLQHDLLAHQIPGRDLDAAAANDEHPVARIAEAEQHIAGREMLQSSTPASATRSSSSSSLKRWTSPGRQDRRPWWGDYDR
jgi:hypothetical protein